MFYVQYLKLLFEIIDIYTVFTLIDTAVTSKYGSCLRSEWSYFVQVHYAVFKGYYVNTCSNVFVKIVLV